MTYAHRERAPRETSFTRQASDIQYGVRADAMVI
jgi:hypothetical protein